MKRRDLLLTILTSLGIAACGGTRTTIQSDLPPETNALIRDATAVIDKVKTLPIPAISDWVGKATFLINTVKNSPTAPAIKELTHAMLEIATLLPAPYGTIALAIETLFGTRGGRTTRVGMTPDEARRILQS